MIYRITREFELEDIQNVSCMLQLTYYSSGDGNGVDFKLLRLQRNHLVKRWSFLIFTAVEECP